jgi:hypothetical protein
MGLYLGYVVPLLVVPYALVGLLAALATSISPDAGAAVAVIGMGVHLVVMGVVMVLSVYLPAAVARMTVLNRMSAGFEVKENVALIWRNGLNYLLAVVMGFAVQYLGQFVGMLACCVGILPGMFWSLCVTSYLMGDFIRKDAVLGTEPVDQAPAAAGAR